MDAPVWNPHSPIPPPPGWDPGTPATRKPSAWWYLVLAVLAVLALAVWYPYFAGTTRTTPARTVSEPLSTPAPSVPCYRLVSFTDVRTMRSGLIEIVARGERSSIACASVEASDLHQFGSYFVHVTQDRRVEDGMTLAGTTVLGDAPVEVYDDGTPLSVTSAEGYISGTHR
jgi:hypothetical protein